jgi:hypothetical protein
MDEYKLISQAARRGLHGVVITEHHYQWTEEELAELKEKADVPGFVLLAGFEYSSEKGDILVYGLEPEAAHSLMPGRDPIRALQHFQEMGGACIAAHPTRAAIPFDDRILEMSFEALEVQSTNLKGNEQRLAIRLAESLKKPVVACSDAHRIEDVGAYATAFEDPIYSRSDLLAALKSGRFRPIQALG